MTSFYHYPKNMFQITQAQSLIEYKKHEVQSHQLVGGSQNPNHV